MDALKEVRTLIIATAVIWLSVLGVSLLGTGEFILGVAAIFAVIGTITIWSMWALGEYGIHPDGIPQEKPKREEDPRISLLLSMLTPDQRDALQSRLMEDLNADGENVSMADLLADQEHADQHVRHGS